jgi:regulator of nucleoside diphosphate kinase
MKEAFMSALIEPATRPAILITDRDLHRLEQLASVFLPLGYPVAQFLTEELERAEICPASEVPSDVVTMNSRVVFRIGSTGAREHRILVYPEDYPVDGRQDAYVSVLTPVGAALIGLRVGSGMEFETLNGRRQSLVVEDLAYQPEDSERHARSSGDDDPGPSAA